MSDPSNEDSPLVIRQQRVLAQFGEVALRSDDLDEILTEACRLVGEALGTDLAKVVELQPNGTTLLVRAGVGWKDGVIGVATIEAGEDTSEGYALKTGEPMVSPDIARETRFRYASFLVENGAKAVANVIIIGGKGRPPFGILQVDSRQPRQFTDNDVAFLRSYANLLAATVDRLRVLGEMRDNETRLRLALEAGELGSFEFDLTTNQVSRSKRYDSIFGYDVAPRMWSHEDVIRHVVPEDREQLESALKTAISEGSEWHVQSRIRRNDDDALRWVEIRTRPDGENHAPTRLVGVIADITARKEAEQALAAANATLEIQVGQRTISLAESNAQLDAFAYTVSHDLRAPLRAMEGFARILLDDFAPKLGKEGARFATRIVNAAKRMEVLIDDLLAFSRVQRSDIALQAIDPSRAFKRAAAELLLQPGREPAKIDLSLPLPFVRADRTILGQVIENLMSNAAKFRREGVPLQIVVRAERRGRHVRIWVEDNGIGIELEHQARIFNVFERLHGQEAYPGTGVGLAIVKAGIERMNGTFGVESTLGHGSKFWFELDAADVDDSASDDRGGKHIG